MAEGTTPEPRAVAIDSKGARIVARTLMKDLRGQGYGDEQVLALASELLGLVAADIRSRRASG